MPRQSRIDAPGALHHIIARGIGRKRIFTDGVDRDNFSIDLEISLRKPKQGKRSDLVGGGLIRSAGGWSAIKALRRIGAYQKGDEPILGDSDFVKKVLGRVAELLDLKSEQVLAVGKYKKTLAARSWLCFWATSELGMSQSELGQKLKISQPAVSLSVKRGEQLVIRHNYSLKA